MKKRLRLFLVFAVSIIVVVSSKIVSIDKFGTPNAIASSIGFARIMVDDTPYVKIRYNPKIYLAKPEIDIIETLEGFGYKYKSDERLGALMIFEKYGVFYSVNRYFSKWEFAK